jgi:hypothetical protein
MLNRIYALTAVALSAAAGLFVAGPGVLAQQGMSAQPIVERDLSLPVGITARDLNADKSIEKLFRSATNDSMNKTGFDNIVASLVDQDRDRLKASLSGGTLGNIDGNKNKQLTDLIADIEGSWKSKYNQNFDADYTKVFTANALHIQTGEVADPQLLIGKWPVDPRTPGSAAGKVTQSDIDQAQNRLMGGNVNLEKGRNVAIAHLMGSTRLNGANASLVHEAGGWKFDVPNTLTAQRLYNNLVSNLAYLDQRKNEWPADVNEGYRDFARAVTASLYDIPLTRDGGTVNVK